MAVITTAAAGNWSATGTWTGGVVPGNGDTVTITHAVVCDVNTTVGTSPDDTTTNVLTTTGVNASLTIATGVVLTVLGNAYFNSGTSKVNFRNGLLLEAGSQFLSGSAALPSRAWRLKLGEYTGLYARGTSSDRCIVGKAAGKGPLVYGLAGGSPSAYDCEYTDFIACDGFRSSIDGRYHTTISFKNCRWILCTGASFSIMNTAAATFLLEDSYIGQSTSATSTNKLQFNGLKGFLGSAIARRFFSDDRATWYPPTGWEFDNCIWNGGFGTAVDSAATKTDEVWQSAENCLFRTGNLAFIEGSISNSYLLNDTASDNPKLLQWSHKHSQNEISGCVCEAVRGSNGDLINPAGLPTAQSTTRRDARIENTIWLLNAQGNSPGKCVSYWPAAADSVDNVFMEFENNTVATTRTNLTYPETGFGLGELVGTTCEQSGYHTGMLASFKNNLFWSPPTVNPEGSTDYPKGGFKLVRQQCIQQDMLLADDADYNYGWNLSEGTEGDGYHCVDGYTSPALFSSGTPDVNGGDLNPNFVDTDRYFANYHTKAAGLTAAAWATGTAYLVGDLVSVQVTNFYGGQTINFRCIANHTSATGNATLGKPGDASSWTTSWEFATHALLREDPSELIDILAWVKAGHVPQNMTLADAGEAGTFVGAFMPISADDTAPVLTDATATATGPTTATASVTTDDGNGTLYFLASTNATVTDETILAALSQSVTTDGEQSISLAGLDPETDYYVFFIQTNAANLTSEQVRSALITTPAIVYPEISATTSASSTSAVSATVTTDKAGGTIYGVLSESTTEMEAADIKSGADDSAEVTDAGDYTLNETGLATWTQYYWHIVHEDADGLMSNVLTIPVRTLDISLPLAFSDTAPATLLTVQVWSKMPKKADVEGLC